MKTEGPCDVRRGTCDGKALCFLALLISLAAPLPAQTVTRYVRYQQGNTVSSGILEGDRIRQVSGDI